MAIREITLSLTGTSTKTVPLWVAQRGGTLRSGDWAAEGATDGAKTVTIKNATQNVNLTAALTINGVAALARASFALASTNVAINPGDVIVAVYTVNTAGSVAPGESAVTLTIDDILGQGGIGG